jgi:hypothetical protein
MFLPSTLGSNWPTATSNSAADSDYEIVAAHVFRFEYYFLLPDGTFSASPWSSLNDASTGNPAMKDIRAIIIGLAVLDPKSRVLLSDPQLATIAQKLDDYSTGAGPLAARWQAQLASDSDIQAMPKPAINAIRFYERYFYLQL